MDKSALSTSPPRLRVLGDNFQALLVQSVSIATSSYSKATITLQNALYKSLVVDLKYFVLSLWTIQSELLGLSESMTASISIRIYVDLDRPLTLCGKYSSIDLWSIDSERIRSPCT